MLSAAAIACPGPWPDDYEIDYSLACCFGRLWICFGEWVVVLFSRVVSFPVVPEGWRAMTTLRKVFRAVSDRLEVSQALSSFSKKTLNIVKKESVWAR